MPWISAAIITFLIVLIGSSCGVHLRDETAQLPPAVGNRPGLTRISEIKPMGCQATGADDVPISFPYPDQYGATVFENPGKTLLLRLESKGAGLYAHVQYREKPSDPYLSDGSPIWYGYGKLLTLAYAYSMTVTTAGPAEIDPWKIRCEKGLEEKTRHAHPAVAGSSESVPTFVPFLEPNA